MKKTIIIIRHGETTNNKLDPDRELTSTGYKQIGLSATKIKGLLLPKCRTAIICSCSIRTMLSAKIISNVLNDSAIFNSSGLQLEGFSKFAKKHSNPVRSYVELLLNNKLPRYVETPIVAINKFNSAIDPFLSQFDVIIVVSHGGFLDVIAKFHPFFIKANKKPVDYGEFRHTFFEDNL